MTHDQAQEVLNKILSRQEFQPHPRPLTWEQRLLKSYGAAISKIQDMIWGWFKQVRDWIRHGWEQASTSIALPDWLKRFFESVGEILSRLVQLLADALPSILLVLGIATAAYLLFRLFQMHWTPKKILTPNPQTETPPITLKDLEKLIHQGDLRGLIECLRLALRQAMAKSSTTRRDSSHNSLTDRSILSTIDENDPRRTLTRETFDAFEQWSFQGNAISESAVHKLYADYQRLGDSK